MMMPAKLKSFVTARRELVLYGVIGFSGALLDFLGFLLFHYILHVPAALASFMSVSLGIINNFVLNAFFNFKRTNHLIDRFLRFYSVGLVGAVASSLLITIFMNLGASALISKLLTIVPVVLIQYFANKKWSFQDLATDHTPLLTKARQHISSNPGLTVSLAFGLLTLLVTAPYFKFVDESDNILGGKLILQGHLPYAGFFSHHTPLAYYIAAVFLLISKNLVVFRLLVALTNFFFLALNARLIQKVFGNGSAILFSVLAPIMLVTTWGNMLLAETLIAHLVLLCVLLIIAYRKNLISTSWQSTTFLLAIAAIPLLGLSYILIALLLFLPYFYYLLTSRRPKLIAKQLAVIAAPFMVLLLTLLVTHSLRNFIFDNYTFNNNYYSQFTNISPLSVIGIAKNLFFSLYGAIATDQRQLINGTFVFLYPVIAIAIYTSAIKKQYGASVLLITLSALSLARVQSFGDSTGVHYLLIWHMLAIFSFAVAWQYWLRLNLRSIASIGQLTGAILSVPLLIIFLLFGVGGMFRNLYFVVDTYARRAPVTGNVMIYDDEPTAYTTEINHIADQSPQPAYVWMGPLQFLDLYHTTHPIASEYTFYLPWQGICPSCTNQILNDFASKRPVAIYWPATDPIILSSYIPKDYGRQLNDYIQKNYTPLSGSNKDVYVRNDLIGHVSP